MYCMTPARLACLPVITAVAAARSLPHPIDLIIETLMVWLAVSVPVGVMAGNMALGGD
jgi:hypothetical protein